VDATSSLKCFCDSRLLDIERLPLDVVGVDTNSYLTLSRRQSLEFGKIGSLWSTVSTKCSVSARF
jgi:hypothetical protein